MIDHNHPAVEAAADALRDGGYSVRLARAGIVLNVALPHLTADDLRQLPQVQELMAETWQEGAMAHAAATSYMTPGTSRIVHELIAAANPYPEETPHD